MKTVFASVTELETLLDVVRFGMTQAAKHELWYGHGTDNAWDEFLALVGGSLHLPFEQLPALLTTRLTLEEKQFLGEQLKKRIVDHIPVPYLTHQAYFCGEAYYVDERVLIPRSPIAELIEQHFEPWVEADSVRQVLDLCTGSGCIAIACAQAFPEASVDAVDLSEAALVVASKNVKQHQVQDRVQLIQSDLWNQLPLKQYDIIISNPPYVGAAEMETLPAEYHHEPRLALEASDNGLTLVHRILRQAKAYLAPNGILLVEVGNSEAALIEAYPEAPFMWLEFERGGQGVFLLTEAQVQEIASQ